jgi:hypothetical protein
MRKLSEILLHMDLLNVSIDSDYYHFLILQGYKVDLQSGNILYKELLLVSSLSEEKKYPKSSSIFYLLPL